MPDIPFRRITIVGVGLIGGSIGLALRRCYPAVRITGVDRPHVLRRARSRGAIHQGTSSLASGLARADLVVLAVPVDVALRLMPRLARHAPPKSVITDVAGTKTAVLRAARSAGLQERFVGGHPMAGSERTGVDHAEASMFRDASWILCPAAAAGARRRVRSLVTGLGARPVTLEARRHDALMARLSHLPQLVSVAMVNAAARGIPIGALRLAGPAFRQMSRPGASSPSVWRGIFSTNRRDVTRALDSLIGELRLIRGSLASGCRGSFRRSTRILRRMRSEPAPKRRMKRRGR